MAKHIISKGLDIPIAGEPEDIIDDSKIVKRVAIMADDYVGMRPTFKVNVGERVKRGQVIFENKKLPGVLHTSFACGVVRAINRGERRALQSVVIDVEEEELSGKPSNKDQVGFANYKGKNLSQLSDEDIKNLLVESGMWLAFRTRPFGKNPAIDSIPHSIFITAMDTNPLAPRVERSAKGREEDILLGVEVIKRLTPGYVYFCKAPGIEFGVREDAKIKVEEFEGPHPSGLPGTHIHFLDPVDSHKTVWYIGIQDVIAIGHLFRTGLLDLQRLITLAGPGVKKPRYLKVRVGASIDEIVSGELKEGELRVISGSVLSGRKAMGEVHGYLGRYHQQITVLREGREREFLGWLAPGANKFSVLNLFASSWFGRGKGSRKFEFTTSLNGSHRAIIPIGVYEKVMPLDIIPTFLLRALAMDDVERAEQLGCLELEEEDLALCSFVCPGKNDFGAMLRRNLEIIEKEG
ncbi:MAG: Na(+)-translocating NADH-quinone reductase subunit A [Candidatus Hydrogenedentes bacterium]|nr:Na(+)-translocating NADH-quinone reductase subunit A [Candidatus Hydrogenedentota bacterium]